MEIKSVSVNSYQDASGKEKTKRNKNIDSRNLTPIDTISVDVSYHKEINEGIKTEEDETVYTAFPWSFNLVIYYFDQRILFSI